MQLLLVHSFIFFSLLELPTYTLGKIKTDINNAILKNKIVLPDFKTYNDLGVTLISVSLVTSN